MYRTILFLLTLSFSVSVMGADESLKREADQRRDRLSNLYNYDKNDSLIMLVPGKPRFLQRAWFVELLL